MAWFGRKNKEEEEDELLEEEFRPHRLRDLKPENRKTRKEPVKPWGKKERLVVLIALLGTVLGSGFLSVSARGFKLPNLPRIKLGSINLKILNPFREQTVTVGKKANDKDVKIIKNFEEKTKPLSGIYAFYLFDLADNNSFGVNEDETMQAASLIKLPVIYSFYKEVEKGNVSFEEKVKYEGTTVTYRDLIRLMSKKSDNVAFSIVRQKLGDTIIQQYISDLGLSKTNLKENLTTPKETSVFFQQFWQFPTKEKNEILDYLTDTVFEDFLPKGIPDNIKVAHKYGREVHVINDGGIVLTDKPFIVVIMTDKIIESEATTIIPELSKLVFDGYTM